MIKIYDINDNVLMQVEITSAAKREQEMSKSDYISLSFSAAEKVTLPVGAYIIHTYKIDKAREVTRKFLLLDAYEPTQIDEMSWKYEPQFQHPKMILSKTPFFIYTHNSKNEEIKQNVWSFVGTTSVLSKKIEDFLNNDLKFGNCGWKVVMQSVTANTVNVSFSDNDFISALTAIANAIGDNCEWHIDYDDEFIYIGKVIIGSTPYVLEVGKNVGVPSVSNSKEDYYNAFSVFGGTRNITQVNSKGENISSGDIRLQLSEGEGTITIDGKERSYTIDKFSTLDLRENKDTEPLFTKVLDFTDVFPSLNTYVYNVRGREKYVLTDGKKIPLTYNTDGSVKEYKTFTVWYMRLAYPSTEKIVGKEIINTTVDDGVTNYWYDFEITDNLLINGKNIGCSFEANFNTDALSTPLAGRGSNGDYVGFELTYHKEAESSHTVDDVSSESFSVLKGDYEIIYQEDNDVIVPTNASEMLVPRGEDKPSLKCNITVLYNIAMADSIYYSDAQQRLLDKAKKEIVRLLSDLNNYTVKSYSHEFLKENPQLQIGQSVTYKDGHGYELDTRVLKLSTNIDYDIVQEITVGNQAIKGTITQLKEDVQTIIASGGGNGSENSYTVAQIRSMIARYGSDNFLSKQFDDTAQGLITFLRGLQVGDYNGENGGSWTPDSDGRSHLVTDYLEVRMKAIFEELVIKKTSTIGGKEIISPAGGVVAHKVDEVTVTYKDVSQQAYRCYFLAEQDGDEVDNDFALEDQVRSESFNVKKGKYHKVGNHFLWRLVIGRDEEPVEFDGKKYHYIDLSVTDCATASDAPMNGDVLSQCGNRSDKERQNCLIFSAVDTFSPSITLYHGINSYSFANKEYVEYGVNKQTNKAFFNVYGDMYVGDRPTKENNYEGSSYVKYDSESKKVTIKAELSVGSTFDGKTLEQQIKDNAPKGLSEGDVNTIINNSTVISDLQNQIDGAIETWFYDGVPTLSNAPAKDWTTDKEKNTHLGDLYYDNKTGKAYRFAKDGSTYKWTVITDTDITKALDNASKAQETADGKMTVFSSQPKPPYQLGDIWVNATYPTDGSTYKNDVLRCKTSKKSGTFSINDWMLASKYTDDTVANAAKTAAENAQKAASKAQSDVNNLGKTVTSNKTAFDKYVSDGYLEPSEIAAMVQDSKRLEDDFAAAEKSYNEVKESEVLANTKQLTDLVSAFGTFNTAKTELITYISDIATRYNAADSDGKATIVSAAGTKYTNFQSAYSAFYDKLGLANAYITSKIYGELGIVIGDVASYNYLKKALSENAKTDIVGGLILSSLIALRDPNTGYVQSGINGVVDTTAKGNGIATWWGGYMNDGQVVGFDKNTDITKQAATSLVRFDGSGYLANGSIYWGTDGKVHADPTSFIISEKNLGAYLAFFEPTWKTGSDGSNVKDLVSLTPQAPFAKLGVSGDLNVEGKVTINGVTITYDASNKALKIDGSIYATGGISAYGDSKNEGGGGLNASVLSYANILAGSYEDSDLTHIPNAYAIKALSSRIDNISNELGGLNLDWSNITGKPSTFTPSAHTHKWADITDHPTKLTQFSNDAGFTTNKGTVTSVAMTAPTGFAVTGSPITTSGTLALGFASGYSLPTTTKQGQWDTAYTQRHTHSNKAVLDNITSSQVTNWDATYSWYKLMTTDEETADGIINKWNEVVNFLANINQTDTLSGIVDGINTSISNETTRATKAESSLNDLIVAETNRAKGAESTLNNKFGNYLPLTGGTLTGGLTVKANVTATGIGTFNSLRIGSVDIKVDADGNLYIINKDGKTAANMYATGGISAYGGSSITGQGGLNGKVLSYDTIIKGDYADTDLTSIPNAYSIKALYSKINDISSTGATDIDVTGSGNAITAVSKSGNVITFTKGSTFLTSHQSLAAYLKTVDADKKYLGMTATAKNSEKFNGRSFWEFFVEGRRSIDNITSAQLKAHVDNTDVKAGSENFLKLNSGSYSYDNGGSTATLLVFTNSGASASSLELFFNYTRGSALRIRRTIDNNRISGDWEDLITSVNIGKQSVSYATSAGAVSWANVTGKPETFAPSAHTHTFASLTDKPTSLSGYGIANAYDKTTIDSLIKTETDRATKKEGELGTSISTLQGYFTNGIANNSDKLDGYHASGLLTALANSGNNVSLTVGGTTKTLTVAYATKASQLSTARKLWGNVFNGTSDINGSIAVPSDKYITIGNIKLEYDADNKALKVTNITTDEVANLYTSGGISAYGSSSVGGNGGLDGSVLSLATIQSSTDLDDNDLTKIPNAYAIKYLISQINDISANGVTDINVTGSGNAVTAVQQDGRSITFVKGATYLTAHQSLAAYLKSVDAASTYSPLTHTHKVKINGVEKVITKTGDTATVDLGTYLTSHQSLANYYTKGEVDAFGYTTNKGTVTSVKMTLPTGLSLGDTKEITTSGTFAVGFTSGYSIPTTAKQTAWDGAVSAKHTHSNKAVLDGITSTLVTNWNTAYTNNHTHSNKNVLDGISSTKVSHWDSAYNWYALMTTDETEADGVINKWNEVVNFLANIAQTDTLSGIIDGINKSISDEATRAKGVESTLNTNLNAEVSRAKGAEGTLNSAITTNKTAITTLQGYFTSGSANSAIKLQTARTLWGQSFDGSANVSGNLSSVGNITSLKSDTYSIGSSDNIFAKVYAHRIITPASTALYLATAGVDRMMINSGGLIGMGTTSPTEKLHVVGNLFVDVADGGYINIGGIKIQYDKANGAIKVNGNLYATGGVSAYGSSDAQGGGGLNGSVLSYADILASDYEDTDLTKIPNAYAIKALSNRIESITSTGATDIEISGSGNAITSVTKDGNVITFTKGVTFLTSHQSLSAYLKSADAASTYSTLVHTHKVKINGVVKEILKSSTADASVVDLGTYLTSHQSLADYLKSADAEKTYSKLGHTHGYATTVNVGSTSYTVASNVISLPAYPTIPTALKNPNALTIQANGTSLGTYDGSVAKTFNLTYSNVGAAAASHTHTFASLTSKPTTLSEYGITDAYTKSESSGKFMFNTRQNIVTDFDKFITTSSPHIYEMYNVDNRPGSNSWVQVMNWNSTDANYGFLLANDYSINGHLYFRHKQGASGWQAWKTIIDSSNIGEQSVKYATSAGAVAWVNVTGKPTSLSGYGIADGVNSVSVTGSGNAITAASLSGHALTLTKGSTFSLSNHNHDNTYLKLSGGTLTGGLTVNANITATGIGSFGKVKIGDIYIINDGKGNLYIQKTDGTTAANFYATGGVTAYGESSTSSGGGGLNALVLSYESALKLTSNTGELSQVASAWSVKALHDSILDLQGGSATNIETTGSGNAVTSITKDGTTISVVKGSTFLTAHQSLADYLKITDAKTTYSPIGHTHSVKINGATKTIAATSGTVVDLGTYLTSHQTIYGLTIQKNGTSLGTYTPNSGAKTINVTVPTKVSELTNDSKYITGNQSISLTGDVTGSGTTSIATTIGNGKVSNAKLANSSIKVGSRSVSLGGTLTQIDEAYLSWGGRNYAGNFGPLDASLVPELGANRLAFMPANAVTIEYSRDGGTTWVDYGASDAQKINLFNGCNTQLTIGKNTSLPDDMSKCMLRVTFDSRDGAVYTALQKFVILVSTNNATGCYVTIDGALGADPTNFSKVFVDKVSLNGWSGYNVINPTNTITTWGGGDVPFSTMQYKKVRFTFGCTGKSSGTQSGLQVISIFGFGGVGWATPSSMARNGHIYTYDYNKNVTFPSIVNAKTFVGSLSGKATSATSADTASKVANALSWSGYSSGSYNGSAAKTITIPNNTNQLTNGAGFTTNKGTVTSVGLTVPTGLSISGSPITTSGTLAISLASGYSIPTTAKQGNWDSVYNWYVGITKADTDNIINKWDEIIAFLANIKSTETLDGIVSGINTSISNEVTRAKNAESALATRATTLEGYFTSGSAKKAIQLTNARKLWGNSFNGTADVNGSIVVPGGNYISIGNIKLEYDSTNKALKITNTTTSEVANLYASGGISAYGDGTSSAGGSVLSSVAYSDSLKLASEELNKVATAYSIAQLSARIATIESGAVMGSVDWDAITNKPSTFAPSSHTHTFASLTEKPSTLGGYGITDAKIANGVITLGGTSITPLTSHQSLGNCAQTVTTTGSGNAVTAISKSGSTITVTKGTNFLTSHQSLAGYATESWVNNKGYITSSGSCAYASSSSNADTLDGWHKDEINRTLFITSGTSGLSSYWAKLWEATIDLQYNDLSMTFLASNSYYPSYFGIFSVYIRQNGSGTSKNFTARLVELVGNIALGDSELRLYYNNTTGNCQLWGNVKTQYGVMTLTVLKKNLREDNDFRDIGTFYNTRFSSVQTLPNSNWSKVGVTQQSVVGSFNPTSHTHTWSQITDRITKVSQLTNDSGYITSSGSCNYANSAGNADTVDGVHMRWNHNTSDTYIPVLNNNNLDYITKSELVGQYNSASATKLKTARTLWGQSFDGTGNVSGTLSGVDGIKFTGNGPFHIDHQGNIKASQNSDNFYYHIDRYDSNAALKVYSQSGSIFTQFNTYLATSSGRVGIGTTSVTHKLQILDTTSQSIHIGTSVEEASISYQTGKSTQWVAGIYTDNWFIWNQRQNAVFRCYEGGNVVAKGGITAYSSSDRRLKKDLAVMDSLSVIKSLGSVYSFTYRKSGERSIGLIAQNVERSTLSDLVAKDDEGYLKLNYWSPKLISLALGGVMQVDSEVNKLKRKVRKLEQVNQRLIMEVKQLKDKENKK